MNRMLAIPLLALLPSLAGATIIFVPYDQPTIQAGIDAAGAGDTVLVACDVYYEYDILMKSGACLRSETGEPDCVSIDAQGQGRVLCCEDLDETTLIEGFTVTGGYIDDTEYYGAGLVCYDASPQVSSCHFTGNEAYYRGGGVFCDNSSASFTDCVFSANTAGSGGGGGMGLNHSDVAIDSCIFVDNYGIDGGGIFCNRSSPIVSHCLFVDNEAMCWGGAIACHVESSPLIRHCTLVRNDAYEGGGIWVLYDSYPTLENSLVAFNLDGTGVWVDSFGSHPSEATLACCDIYGNVDGNYGGGMEDQTGINGNISTHPLFCDFEGGDFTLASGSPCLPENNDCGVLMGAYGQGCDYPTAMPEQVPAGLVLSQNVPNPFNPKTTIRFCLPEASTLSLGIYDLAGRRVRTLLASEPRAAGEHRVVWNGRDDAGRAATSGVYLYRLEAGDRTATRKMTLLR